MSERQTALKEPGVRYLSVARTLDKLSKRKSWLYRTMANDASFPKVLRIGTSPVFIESELDAWVLENTKRTPPRKAYTVDFWKNRKNLKQAVAA